MFDGILTNASPSGLLLVIAALGAFLVVCGLHYYRRGRFRRGRAIIQYVFWLFFLVVAVLIVLPLPVVTPNFCAVHEDAGEPELRPFSFAGDIARHSGFTRQRFSVERMLQSAPFQLAVSNVVAFIPLGIYLRVFTRRRFVTCVLIALGCTLAFELTQGTGIFGLYPCPYRHFNIDDLMLNTLGAVVGLLIVSARNTYVATLTRP